MFKLFIVQHDNNCLFLCTAKNLIYLINSYLICERNNLDKNFYIMRTNKSLINIHWFYVHGAVAVPLYTAVY